MKKTILTLALAGVLTVGATVLAQADETTTNNSKGNTREVTKVQELVNSGVAFEEAKTQMMEEKYNRIDEALNAGKITEEKAAELKETMKERAESCTTPGENRENNGEGMGLGLGKGNGNGKGMGKGNGNGMKLRGGSCN